MITWKFYDEIAVFPKLKLWNKNIFKLNTLLFVFLWQD